MALKNNTNARKEQTGVQVNFYLTARDTEAVRRRLRRELCREPSKQEIRRFAREQSKNGIWQSIKDELPPIIV